MAKSTARRRFKSHRANPAKILFRTGPVFFAAISSTIMP